jgi:hypothetical protein
VSFYRKVRKVFCYSFLKGNKKVRKALRRVKLQLKALRIFAKNLSELCGKKTFEPMSL